MLDELSFRKVDMKELIKIDNIMNDFNSKLKHISVFLTTISMAILEDEDRVKSGCDFVKREDFLK